MANTSLSVALAEGVVTPSNPAPASVTFFDCLFDRSGDSGTTLRDVVRGSVDGNLSGSVMLPDAVVGSPVELRFLAPSGAIKEVVTAEVPPPNTTFSVALGAQQAAAIAALAPRPPPLPEFVRRDARLTIIEGGASDFGGRSLAVAAIKVGNNGWSQLGLDKFFTHAQPVTTSNAFEGSVPLSLSSIPWTPVHLAVDGQFTAYFQKASGDAWLWWVVGGAVGVVIDDLSKQGSGVMRVITPRPANPTGGYQTVPGGRPADARPPTNVTERELTDNPQIYTEDPGEFCRPFSNPERVLGERPFNVIFRAEQPVLSAEASVKTLTGPHLDFEIPLTARDAILRAVEPESVPLTTRIARLTRLARTPAETQPSVAIRMPQLDAFVTHDVVPAALVEEVQRADRGRKALDARHPVQWDSDASRYQAVTVARGHILEYRLRWRSNGYSLGTVAKTLTLAARQVKRIQKVEWRRVERARREERTQFSERAADSMTRDRQYEDGVEATLSEWSRGESESSQAAGAGGFGFAAAGFVIGGGGGGSNASSSASQEGGRRTTASEEQRLRDSIRRYGDSLRRLDSVVVNEVTQEEEVTGTTEIVRNPNFGHALTVIYYQILRHLKVETAFAGVRECLFVPFAIKPFTINRAHRWRDLLRKGLLERRFEPALRYLRDVMTGFVDSAIPPGRRSEQQIRHVSGSLFMTLAVARPADEANGGFNAAAWGVLNPFVAIPSSGIFARLRELAEAQRDREFQAEHAPGIAASWVNTLQVWAGGTLLQADLTLASRYRFNGAVRVDFSCAVGQVLTREMLASLRVVATNNLPANSVANLTRVSVTYQTDQFQRSFAASSGSGDLVSPQTGVRDAGATVFSLPDPWERQDVRAEIVRAVNDLVSHLNEHVEHYHKVVWWNMDRDRIFMLVDGFEVPGTNGTSIGSVIEREPIAIIGNSLVFRVSAGSFLGLGDMVTPAQLYNYYAIREPVADPMLISLPTDGLYAQTIMDECEALEEHQGNTDWVLSDKEPEVGDIDAGLLASRRAEPPAATPTPFPQTLINLQNAPEAPAPAGLAGALGAVTNANAFRDMAGLAGTQANAAAAFQAAASLATNFGNQAAALKLAQTAKAAQSTATADQRLASVQRANAKQLVTPDEARDHANRILDELHPSETAAPHESQQIAEAIDAATGMRGSTVEATTADGQVRVVLASNASPAADQECGFWDLTGRRRTEGEVRAAIVTMATDEQELFWFVGTPPALLEEDDDVQFEHLVRYWLEVNGPIGLPNMGAITLALGDSSLTPAAKFLRLLGPINEPQANIDADVQLVATSLLANVPDPANPANLRARLITALRQARRSRLGPALPQAQRRPWSGCFINTTIREAERNLDLEGQTGATETLLALSSNGRHWEYVKQAHVRRFGCLRPDGTFDASCQRDGTFHAFEPNERPVKRGDIIVQDRRSNRTPNNVWQVRNSQANQGDMHGDIVVDIDLTATPPFAEVVGGNVGDSVRRRRFPLNADGTVTVDRAHNFVQQNDNGSFPNLPVAGSAAGNLDDLSTRRVFALLSLEEHCQPLTAPNAAGGESEFV